MVIGGIVIAAAAFYAGTYYQSTKAPQFAGMRGQFQNMQGNNRTGGTTRMGFRPVSGEIIDADAASITVKTQDGSSRIVVISDKTTVTEATEAAKTTLIKGAKVAVFGTENSDGSLTAQTVQLNPVGNLRQR